jgi:hypothetical protein
MNSQSERVTSGIALFLSFAILQVYIGVGFGQSGPASGPSETAAATPQQATGSLSVQGGKAITVNGASAITGATILSGASIETLVGVGGTVSLGSLGSLQIEPNSKVTLEFQDGSIKVMLLQGCVTLHTNSGTAGEIDNPQGVAGKTDPKADGVVRVCFPEGGAVMTAPASAERRGGLFGLGTAATIAIIAGAGSLVGIPVIFPKRNPSPTTP